ncbi:hypothetical protein Dacet_1122 [Denitrovibrio acetiphilus DSM 12809]|uniref:Uncharacterized protein n=1 Tax=Denitrovibrio acetiphilus (strain DSM 12809 / NBRC 114555 / N2460) TaxID=522772 RepID=D4H795_DENA2|nr:DUF6731 family protein [Denitrovibrio acetiphilus]ADD67894.1 hypothetical protein Dacet_1122 [Denitrovibrio acetiphilus DSM 12809]
MSERKNITINYYRLEAAEEVFYHDLDDRLTTLADGGMDFGFFDGRSKELMFKIFDPIEISDRKLHFVSLIKEKQFLPVWFNREGDIEEAPLEGGMLGDISYGLIDPMLQCVIMFSGGFGPGASGFADFARWLTDDQSAGCTPIFINNAYDQVTQWEVYRKLNISIEAPALDFVDNVLDSEYGSNFEMLNTLKGLKIDLAVSMGHTKGSLDKDLVRKFIKKVLEENFAGKLKVAGKNFDEQSTEEHDLYSAKLKHKTEIVVSGMHISPEEAKSSLFEAYQINLEQIESAVADFEEE